MTSGGDVDLSPLTSLRLPARAGRLLRIDDPEQLPDLAFDPHRDLVLGGGSNVLLAGDVPGTVFLNRLRDRRVLEELGAVTRVRVGAGEDWHETVRWTLSLGLSGLENLSLIPGCCGAAPLQNIGAYGVELADHLHRVYAWDWRRRKPRTFDRADCDFSYRDSRFKSAEPDRYLVTGLVLTLNRSFRPRLDYAGLEEELAAMNPATEPTALDVSDAVVRLRRRKLPDPGELPNAGSFFKNPVLDPDQAERLHEAHPDLPLHAAGAGRLKASAAWMIERCGWKGRRNGDAGVSELHALVLVNHGNATGRQLVALARQVRASVRERFGVDLENEPRIIDPSASKDPNFRPTPESN